MKALSVRQPWAYLIVTGEKPVENRGWSSAYFGPLLIHAALTPDLDGGRWVSEQFPNIRIPPPRELAYGAIIGGVRMLGGSWMYESSPWFTGPYGFMFDRPRMFPAPIPYKGQLGFFDVPDGVLLRAGLDPGEIGGS